MATTDTLTSADRTFVKGIDDAVRGAVRRAGRHVQCRRGCTPCCIGLFDITALDALGESERARRRLFARFAELPCPVLDPRTGTCLLYRSRPVSCRTFGLPVRYRSAVLPPCALNFRRAAPAVVAACTVEADADDVEGSLLARLHGDHDAVCDTVIAAALVHAVWSARGRRVRGERG